MTRKKPGPIAAPQEVLAVFTSIMRGQLTEDAVKKSGGAEEHIRVPPKISEICKAAQLVGKYHGLFDRKEQPKAAGPVTEQVLRLLKEMHDAADAGSH